MQFPKRLGHWLPATSGPVLKTTKKGKIMELNEKTIIPINIPDGADYSQYVGCSCGIGSNGFALIGGDLGVIVGAMPGSVSVALFGGNTGLIEVKLGGAVAAGDALVRDPTTGTFSAATSTDIAEARAIEGGAADELIPAVLFAPAMSIAGHAHDGDYAAADHNHDSDYAAADHNHDSDYAAADHNHDGVYAPLGG